MEADSGGIGVVWGSILVGLKWYGEWYGGRFWWFQSSMEADSGGFRVVWGPIVVVLE